MINAGTHTEKDRLAKTVLRLVESFYAELSIPEKQGRRKDADSLRQRLTASLEEAVKKFPQHRSMEVVESLVLVAKPQNVSLRYLLQQPGSETHDAVVEVLTQSTRGGVIRMLLAFLEDPLMPQAVRKVLVGRSDVKFVEHLSLFVGSKPSKAVVETLPQFDGFAWATADAGVLVQLSEQAQAYAVNVLTGSGMKAPARQEALGALLLEGKPAGRRAAAQALADIESPEANALVVRALTDEDGEVRAQAIRQLRARKIPGALSLLIRMVGSTEEPIREALREALPEFSFRQFLASLDSLDERSAQTVGQVVRWIDRDPVSQLIQEMKHLSPVRRRRATQAADAMNMVSAVEPQVIELLNDDDHVVRQAAAKALADCGTQPSWEALRDALLDRSVIVQEAAEHSLERLSSLLSNEVKQTELVEAVAMIGNLLAAADVASRRVHDSAESEWPMEWLLAAAAAAVVVGVGIYLVRRQLCRGQTSHAALFRGLCEAQGLSRISRRLLRQIGQHHRLAQPARIFVDPRWLDPAGLSPALRLRSAELAALRQSLFGIGVETDA